MFFKTHIAEILMLLLTVIVFAWIGQHNMVIVPYNESIIEGMETVPVPKCHGSHDVPDCQTSVTDEYDPYSYDNKYILKTQVVPPICPACPSVINNHNHGNNLYDGLKDENNSSVTTEISNVEISNSESNQDYNNNVTNIENTTILDRSHESKNQNVPHMMPESNSKNQNDPRMMPESNFKNQNVPRMMSDSDSKLSGQCPPCPACDRCPEPAFTCEKVVNYKSPASKQYLPMPVLNDFSSFPSF